MMTHQVEKIAQAIYVVNCHAKTATMPQELYSLKRIALEKLIHEGKARKIGLQYSYVVSKFKRSYVLIRCGTYQFHTPATKKDFRELPHLGHPDIMYRNPKARLSLKYARSILRDFTGSDC